MKKCFFIMVLLMLQMSLAAASGVVVGNGVDAITPEQLGNLYRAKTHAIGGVRVKLTHYKPLQKEFLKKNVGKSVKRLKKIWARKLFAEGVLGPVSFKTPEDLVEYLKETPNSIGYLPSAPKNAGSLKVLLNF